MGATESFVSLPLILKNPLKLVEQLVDVLGNEVSAGGVHLAEVVGRLPLVDEELAIGVVDAVVVIEDSFSDFEVSKTDAPGESSEVIDGDIVLPEEFEDSVGVGVRDGENFLFGEAGVVGAVAHGPGVVVAVKPVEEHDMSNKNNNILSY